LAVQVSYWVIHMTGVALGIVSVFELLIQIGQPHRISETTLRASSHVTSAKSSEICISTRSGAKGDARPELSQIVPEVPGSRVQDKLGPPSSWPPNQAIDFTPTNSAIMPHDDKSALRIDQHLALIVALGLFAAGIGYHPGPSSSKLISRLA
jgi:hypothetical protein